MMALSSANMVLPLLVLALLMHAGWPVLATSSTTIPKTTKAQELKVIVQEDPVLSHYVQGQGYEGLLVDIYLQAFALANKTPPALVQGPDHNSDVIKALSTGEADIALVSLNPTVEWVKLVTFTQPFFTDGYKVLYKVYDQSRTIRAIETLVQPFSPGLWLLVVLAICMASVCLLIIGRLSPYEDIALPDKDPSTRRLTLIENLFYLYGVLLWQGGTTTPRSLSGRCVALVWWVFSFLVVASYIAGLSASLLKVNRYTSHLPFTSIDGLSRQDDVGILVVKDGDVMSYMKKSVGANEKRIVNSIMKHKDVWIRPNSSDAVKMIKENEGKYVLLTQGMIVERLANSKPCNLAYLPGVLGSLSYSVACKKGLEECDILNQGILAMAESGKMSESMDKWFKSECVGDANYLNDGIAAIDSLGMGESSYITPLTITIERFSAAFILLAVGLIVAGLFLIGEHCCASRSKTSIPRRFGNTGPHEDPSHVQDYHE